MCLCLKKSGKMKMKQELIEEAYKPPTEPELVPVHLEEPETDESAEPATEDILELTEEEIKEYREAFEMFDKNKDGQITRDEIRDSIKKCGLDATDGEVAQILKETDRDGSGTIEWDEFLKAMTATKRRMSLSDTNYLEAFNVFDVDKDGEISRKELISAVQKLGLGFIYTPEVIDRMFSLADANKDGKISRAEFVAAMKKGI